ncbi:hypothetical protein FRB91_005897 [Serendipita sp. 411]|nr:hypothetical protein FRC19_002238 [Serendipita sp. 401]KAG8852794.1 hypothetical protein FRB91_005897 [Serendipita sp. 411]
MSVSNARSDFLRLLPASVDWVERARRPLNGKFDIGDTQATYVNNDEKRISHTYMYTVIAKRGRVLHFVLRTSFFLSDARSQLNPSHSSHTFTSVGVICRNYL